MADKKNAKATDKKGADKKGADKKSADKNKDVEYVEIFDDEEIVTVTDEDGNETEFFNIATLDIGEKWYSLLTPCEAEDDEEESLYVFELVEGDDGYDDFIPVEDQAVIDAVSAEFDKMLQQEAEGCDCCDDDDCDCDHKH